MNKTKGGELGRRFKKSSILDKAQKVLFFEKALSHKYNCEDFSSKFNFISSVIFNHSTVLYLLIHL